MKQNFFTGLFQRSALFRFLILPVLFLLFIACIAGITFLLKRDPVIESISPAVAEPEEIVILRGRDFGDEQGDSWIELGGNRLSNSTVIKWSDSTIMFKLPPLADEGLLYVCSRYGKSNPQMLANKKNIPVIIQTASDIGLPVISQFDSARTSIGKRLIITGKNFGVSRSGAQVFFTWENDPLNYSFQPEQMIAAGYEQESDYEYWSDQEIRVRVPDGAATGNVYIQTERGLSNPAQIELINMPGTKKYTDRRTYVLSLQIDITNLEAENGNTLFLRVPRPAVSASQRGIRITESSPDPYMENHRGTILVKLENLRTGKNERISNSFILTNYGIETEINPARVRTYSDKEDPFYLLYTAADPIVPSDNEEIKKMAASITGREQNPYRKANMIYSWLTGNFSYNPPASPDRPVTEALNTQSGDAYDLAVLFCALARASGIPSIPAAGILIDQKLNPVTHYWAEFYIENFGWFPVDPALEIGIPFSVNAEKNRHFGNIDVNHIAFSRGWTDQKPMTPNSKIVYRPRAFAFQSVWEESIGKISGYTSFWTNPGVVGFY
ncbi:IPT/TIG domain-containing protein [Brucepastera parasyntrophica]|uniref:transglutaminase domain-containing protein n=1 Tax=Brucepastera parasyntrophica TaxID=2880008 RepID=UPI00210DB193|nr:transglutaminase domain-containing protein [Brucepastera parasyntrophica]ULQ60654.1 IPT/TIG domain-containing protein [Brucepastera parasyntrophica]